MKEMLWLEWFKNFDGKYRKYVCVLLQHILSVHMWGFQIAILNKGSDIHMYVCVCLCIYL